MKTAISVRSMGALAVLVGLLGLVLVPGWVGAAPEKKSGPPEEKRVDSDANKERGGAGTGTGTGTGNGARTPREKRMLRWHMLFDTKNGDDYLNQLRQLGAILAVRVTEGATQDSTDFRIIRNLGKKPAPLLKEDVRKIQRIYWIDDDPKSVRPLLAALGHPELKSKFLVAFMPEAFEKKLFELETAYRKKHFPKLDEDQIKLTRFKLRAKGKELEPYVAELEPRKE